MAARGGTRRRERCQRIGGRERLVVPQDATAVVIARHDPVAERRRPEHGPALQELGELIQWSSQYDIVTGYRGKRQDPPHRLINALGWKMLVRMVLGVKVRDIDCAFKIFQRSVFDRVQ